MDIYVGRDRNCQAETNQGKRVVLQLVDGLESRNVTCDNFFTSFSLAKELKQQKITLVGTIRKNRKEIPPVLLDMKKKAPLHSEFVFNHSLPATMVSYTQKKNKFVTLLSTLHFKKQVAADGLKKPEIITFYNSTKGGVDTLDKLVGTYPCRRKVNRWPVAVFCNMLDISAYNAFVIFTELNPAWNSNKKKIKRRLFLLDLGFALVRPYIGDRSSLPYGKNASALVKDIQNRENISPSPSLSSSSAATSNSSSKRRLSHSEPTKKRARCQICPYRSNANTHSVRCDMCK